MLIISEKTMIDKRFIDSANEIRKEYKRLSKELDKKEEIVQEFKQFLNLKIEDLNKFKEETLKKIQSKSQEDVTKITTELLQKMTEIEVKEQSLSKKIKDIDDRMKKLQNEENSLLKNIQKTYPNLTLEEIKKEVHSKISF